MNYVDPDGRDIWEINDEGIITWVEESEEHRLYSVDSEGNRSSDYVEVKNRDILDTFTDKGGLSYYTSSTNIDDLFKVFLFASNNSNVEWALHRGVDNRYVIGTLHDENTAGHYSDYGLNSVVSSVHSHPGIVSDIISERNSMAFDWDNVKQEVLMHSEQARMNYVYFPNSQKLYHVEERGVRYIHSISNNYKRFYFGTLNHK